MKDTRVQCIQLDDLLSHYVGVKVTALNVDGRYKVRLACDQHILLYDVGWRNLFLRFFQRRLANYLAAIGVQLKPIGVELTLDNTPFANISEMIGVTRAVDVYTLARMHNLPFSPIQNDPRNLARQGKDITFAEQLCEINA